MPNEKESWEREVHAHPHNPNDDLSQILQNNSGGNPFSSIFSSSDSSGSSGSSSDSSGSIESLYDFSID